MAVEEALFELLVTEFTRYLNVRTVRLARGFVGYIHTMNITKQVAPLYVVYCSGTVHTMCVLIV